MVPGVAAGHPATAAAGAAILREGGSAADAAIAASLASCVAETVMTGLLGGGHAIVWDGEAAHNLDCFVAVPSHLGAMRNLPVPFGEELVHYAIGPASCAVPGLPDGLRELHERFGRLPWRRLVEPALALARGGVEMPFAHAECLAMLAPVMTLGRGADLYAPGGRLLGTGDPLRQPGLVRALEVVRDEGPRSAYEGALAEALLGVDGLGATAADLAAYRAEWREPVRVEWAGALVHTRGGLTGIPEALELLPSFASLDAAGRVLALVEAVERAPRQAGAPHTTNLVAVDAGGCAVVLTTSLGLGSGDFLPGLDLHLNSMLGESDLVVGDLVPGTRMESMMAPTLLVDADGPALAIGAAGGTRLRTALLWVLAAVAAGDDPQHAVDAPRVHPSADAVHAEPGAPEEALVALERAGRTVRRWPARHHYFGGVSLLARNGGAADPRRSGAAQLWRPPAA